MRRKGSILISVITAMSLLTSVLPGSVTAEDTLLGAGQTGSAAVISDDIKVSPAEADFGTLSTENGKYADERITVTVTNNNKKSVRFGFLKDKTAMTHFSVLGLGETEKVLLAEGESFSFGLKPKEGLEAGTYKETLGFELNGEDFYSTSAYSLKMALTDDSKYLKVLSDPLQFDLTEDYESADSSKQVSIKNIGSGALRYEGCTVSSDKFTVNPITSSGGSLAAGATASFRVTPKEGMPYDINAQSGKLVFRYTDALGGAQTKIVDLDWRVNAEYSQDITVSPATLDFGTLPEGYSAPAAKTVKISNADEAHNITVYRPVSKYLAASELVCGTEKYQDKTEVVFNKPVSFNVAPVTGRKAGVYEDKLDVKLFDENGNASVKTVKVYYTVKGKEKQYHNVTVEGGKGAAKIDDTNDLYSRAAVQEGSKVVLTAPSDKSSVFKKWEVTSGSMKLDCPNSSDTSFIMGSEDVTVKAVYEEAAEGTHSIIVAPTAGGSAWTDTPTAKKGDHVYVHARPDEGYHFVKYTVTIDDKVVSETEGYNEIDFDLPDKDIFVQAVFEADPYKLTLTYEGMGEVKAGRYTGRENDTAYIAASPESGYRFKEWKVTAGGALIDDPTAQSTKITFGKADAEIEAVFVKREYKVNITAVGNGKAIAEPTYIDGRFLVTAYPDEGYKLKKYTVHLPKETKEVTDNTFYLTCGTAESVDVTVEFEEAPAVTTAVTTGTNITTTTTTTTVTETDVTGLDIGTGTASTEKATSSVTSNTTKTSKTTTSKTTKTTASSKTSKTTASKSTDTKTTSSTAASKTTPPENIYVVYGDADVNDKVDLADVTYLAKHLLSPVSNPLGDADKGTAERAKRSADVNGDGIVDILDLSRLIEYNLGKLMLTDLDPRTRR